MSLQPVMSHGAPIHGSQNLPVRPPERFFGRSSDLDSIHLVLRAGTAVLLHGPAGIGKTALAATLAAGYAELPGGVLWLDLNDDTTLTLLNRVARAFGAGTNTVEAERPEQFKKIRELLQANRPLIVLDGRVRVEAAREFVRECAGGVPLLLTQPKIAAGPWTPHTVKPLEPDDSAAMLSHLAGATIQPDTPGMSALFDILSGYPLAIALAAYQIADGHAVNEFLGQLPDLPPGQTNRIMAVTTAAYRLLTPELQGMAMLLATTFTGGASEELLSDTSGAPGPKITSRMHQLVTRGFASERNVYEQPYFTTHEIIQSFAQAFLRSKQRLDTMIGRHMTGLPVYIRRHTSQDDPVHYQKLAAEIENITAAGHYAAENGKSNFLADLVRLLEPVAPQDFITACGFQPEFNQLKSLLQQPDSQTPKEIPAEEVPALVADIPQTRVEPVPTPEEAVEVRQERDARPNQPPPTFETTQTFAEEPLAPISAESPLDTQPEDTPAQHTEASYQANGSVDDELVALTALAAQNLGSENYGDVLNYVEQGMALAQESNNPQREGELLVLLGDLQLSLGNLDGAEMAYREAIIAFRPVEAWLNIGLMLDKLGSLYWELGRYQDALDTWEQALPIFSRMERPDMLRIVLDKLGDTQTDLRQWDKAQSSYNQALTLAQAADDQPGVFEQYRQIGWVFELRGDRDGAILYYRRALHLAFILNDQEKQLRILLSLAHLMIDDTVTLNRTFQLLEAANALSPDDTEIQRLLTRLKTRRERLMGAGITLTLATESLQNYAQSAFDLNV